MEVPKADRLLIRAGFVLFTLALLTRFAIPLPIARKRRLYQNRRLLSSARLDELPDGSRPFQAELPGRNIETRPGGQRGYPFRCWRS